MSPEKKQKQNKEKEDVLREPHEPLRKKTTSQENLDAKGQKKFVTRGEDPGPLICLCVFPKAQIF